MASNIPTGSKKLFIVQYSKGTNRFQLLEVDNPQQLQEFEIPVIDAPYQSNILLSAYLIDTQITECSYPYNQLFVNPHNAPEPTYSNGYLYNFWAASHPNLAPAGWHLPTPEEWESFIEANGGRGLAGGSFKEVGTGHWQAPNTGASDNIKFCALPAGYRHYNSNFNYFGTRACFWADNPDLGGASSYYYINHNSVIIYAGLQDWRCGLSVRFVKDDNINPGSLIDIDGNAYPTIKNGEMVWLASNWKCTRLSDGTPIANLTENNDWTNTNLPAWCAYNNDLNLI